MKAQEATIASLQCSMGRLSKERDAVVKELGVLRMKSSKQREGLEQCRAELQVEMRACQDKLGQLNKTQQQVRQEGCECMCACTYIVVNVFPVFSICLYEKAYPRPWE